MLKIKGMLRGRALSAPARQPKKNHGIYKWKIPLKKVIEF